MRRQPARVKRIAGRHGNRLATASVIATKEDQAARQALDDVERVMQRMTPTQRLTFIQKVIERGKAASERDRGEDD